MECKTIEACKPCSFEQLNTLSQCQRHGSVERLRCAKRTKFEACGGAEGAAGGHFGLLLLPLLLALLAFVFYHAVRGLYKTHVLKAANFSKI